MTDRVYAYTVILQEPIREDEVKEITGAIEMIKGVQSVTPLVASPEVYFALENARRELIAKIWKVLE